MTSRANTLAVLPPTQENGRTAAGSAAPRNKFMGWRDLVITPLVIVGILASSVVATWTLGNWLEIGLFARLLVFWVSSTVLAIGTIRALVLAFSLKPGVYSYDRHAAVCHAWNLVSFLCITFLWYEISAGMLMPPLRQIFYRLLGARIGPGIVPIGGKITDPWLVEIGEGAMVGDGALLVPHLITPQHNLALGRVAIGRGAVVGAHSVVMGGSTIGEGALVNAMSLVPAHTSIPAYEVWGGNPAVKLSELPRPEPRRILERSR